MSRIVPVECDTRTARAAVTVGAVHRAKQSIRTVEEQADMQARWATQMAGRRRGLDLGTHCETECWRHATLGVDGSVVVHNAEALERQT